MRLRTEHIVLNAERDVSLDCYVIEQSREHPVGHISLPERRPAIVICPGGGYRILADREKLPAALPFMAQGYQTFILHYSIGDHSVYPNPLVDISMAVRWVRSNAERLGIDPDQVAVMGFSAGGHCAAMLATQWHLDSWKEAEAEAIDLFDPAIAQRSNMPNAAILCYAVTDFHAFPNLDETRSDPSALGRIAIERVPEANPVRHVDERTAPTFLWHTAADATVPAMQSVEFARRLVENSVPTELHLYERGEHGIGMGTRLTDFGIEHLVPETVPGWADLAISWLNHRFGYGAASEPRS